MKRRLDSTCCCYLKGGLGEGGVGVRHKQEEGSKTRPVMESKMNAHALGTAAGRSLSSNIVSNYKDVRVTY